MRIFQWTRIFLILGVIAMLGLTLPRVAAAGKAKPPSAKAPHATPAASADGNEESAEPPTPPLPWKIGPAKIDLGHELSLDLRAEHRFLPPAAAVAVLAKMGNFHNENLLGVVTSQADEDWFATIRYEDEGYIKDDEAIDANEILSAIKEGTEEANKERVAKGFKALRIHGWSDAPHYDKTAHHLVWALDVSDDDGKSVNYNTRILGRKGYVSINLVTAPEQLAGYKPQAAALLSVTNFGKGARYEDFDKKTDKVAEYGLAGLVLGGVGLGAAKLVKIGLLAKFSKVIIAALIAGKKLVIAGAIAVGVFFKKFFGRKKSPETASGPIA